jgi:hypothetical protein
MNTNATLRSTLTTRALLCVVLVLASAPAAHAQGPTSAADSLALMQAIYRVAFSNGTQTAHAAALPELVCVKGQPPNTDPPQVVLDTLQAGRVLLVRPMSACTIDPRVTARSSTSLVVDTLTGKRGISIAAAAPKFASDVHSGDHLLPAWAVVGGVRLDGATDQ